MTNVILEAASSLQTLITQSIARYADVPFNHRWSYAKLGKELDARCADWRHQGLRAGDVVTIRSRDREEAMLSLLAALLMEVIPLPIHGQAPDDVDQQFAERVGARFAIREGELQTYPAANPRPHEDTLAIIACTSGTTGWSKLVRHSHATILSNLRGVLSYLTVPPHSTFLVLRDPSYLSVITSEILLGLLFGAQVEFATLPLTPNHVVQQIGDLGATAIFSVPSLMHNCVHAFRRNLAHLERLQLIQLGGEGSTVDTVSALRDALPHVEVMVCYGMTEMATRITFWSDRQHPLRPYCVGEPIPHVAIRAVGDDGAPLGPSEPGRIQISSPSTMLGYIGDSGPSPEWFQTGDWGWVDPDGLVYLQGRYDDMVVRGGVKMPAPAIEHVLLRHPDVEGAFVMALDAGPYQIKILGAVKLRPHSTSSSTDILHWSRAHLPSALWLNKLFAVDTLPAKWTGKLDRLAFRALLTDLENWCISP